MRKIIIIGIVWILGKMILSKVIRLQNIAKMCKYLLIAQEILANLQIQFLIN